MAIFLRSLIPNHFLFVEIFKVALCVPACREKLAITQVLKLSKQTRRFSFLKTQEGGVMVMFN